MKVLNQRQPFKIIVPLHLECDNMDYLCIQNLTSSHINCNAHPFRPKDVGRPKAEVAAEFINNRVPGCNVIPYPFTERAALAEIENMRSSHSTKMF